MTHDNLEQFFRNYDISSIVSIDRHTSVVGSLSVFSKDEHPSHPNTNCGDHHAYTHT